MKNKLIAPLFTCLLLLPGSGFAIDLSGNQQIIWESGNNVFFKYSKVEDSRFGNNDHPATLSEEDLSATLGSLSVRKENDNSNQGTPVFTAEQVELLGKHLSTGFKNAKRDQDIIFALEKSERRALGLLNNDYFVAGRAFVKDNKLNIIIGDYDRPRDTAYEAAYDPTGVGIVRYQFDHGSRKGKAEHSKEHLVEIEGVAHMNLNNAAVPNWLVIDVNLTTTSLAVREQQQKEQEMKVKREELKEIMGSNEIVTQAVVPEEKPASAAIMEQRFITLKQLKDKGLITDEEYAEKRKEMLDEI